MDKTIAKTIPEMRGMSLSSEARQRESERERPYSAASYAAQYGITVEDAETLRISFRAHKEIVREITRMFARDPELRRRALMLDADELDAEQTKQAEEVLAGKSWSEVGRSMT